MTGLEVQTVGVVGAGAWGTALAATVRRTGARVRLWARDPGLAGRINADHENKSRLPGVRLDPALVATADLADLADADVLLLVTPAQATRHVAGLLEPVTAPGTPVAICAKGIEQTTGRLLSSVVNEALPQAHAVVLSGPSFAGDVARALPTAVTLAGRDSAAVETVARAVATPRFRPYLSDDPIGAQAGGAVKNVLAIACGIVEGKGLGASAHAALTARGFAELQRFGVAIGGRQQTLTGLSGLGDLILTCGSRQSRNMSLGVALGQGEAIGDILASRRSVSEGVHTAPVLMDVAGRYGVDMPIASAVTRILAGEIGVDAAIAELLHRPLKAEDQKR